MDSRHFLTGMTSFLKVSDITQPTRVKIGKVREEEVFKKNKLVLYFSEPEEMADKCLSLNWTNHKYLTVQLDHETDKWVGQTIELYVDPDIETPKGDKVGGIRIRVPEVDEGIPF